MAGITNDVEFEARTPDSSKHEASKFANQHVGPNSGSDNEIFGETSDELQNSRLKQIAADGNAHFHRLGWKRLAIVTIVEAIALGALSLPAAYHTLGMFPGVFLTITLGLVTIFTSYLVGQVKLVYPQVSHYADAGRLLFGRFGYELFGAAMVLELVMSVGSHALTGSIALGTLNGNHVCSIVFSAVSAVILFILAIPPSFTEIAVLGYIDFASIIIAIGITIIATGVKARDSPGGLSGVEWSTWPQEGTTFSEAFVAEAILSLLSALRLANFLSWTRCTLQRTT